jgi:hypothetical protein
VPVICKGTVVAFLTSLYVRLGQSPCPCCRNRIGSAAKEPLCARERSGCYKASAKCFNHVTSNRAFKFVATSLPSPMCYSYCTVVSLR